MHFHEFESEGRSEEFAMQTTARILELVEQRGRGTADELEELTKAPRPTIKKRLAALVQSVIGTP